MALAVGMLVAAVSEPGWSVGGAPWVLAYPKNVELRAVLLAVLAGAASPLLGGSRAGRIARALIAAAGAGIGAVQWPSAIPLAAAVAIGAGGLALAIDRGFLRAAPVAAPSGGTVWPWLAGLTVALFICSAGPLTIDVFHHGEVLVTALDLLRGGVPFETIAWPHGAHDSGLAALWMSLTGKVGSSPIALAFGSTAALATVTFYALAHRATGAPLAATLGAWMMFMALLELRPNPNPRTILGLLALPVLSLALASARPPWAAAAGAAAALGVVFRIDAGTYGVAALAAALSAMALLEPGPPAARLRRVIGLGLRAALGAAAMLLALRLLLGWPTTAWYAYMVGSLPRYHSIANGLPYPWPGIALLPGSILVGLVLPAVVVALGALAVRGAIGGAARDRVALLGGVAVLAAGALRSGLGRSDPPHMLYFLQPVLALCALLAASRALVWLATRRRAALLLLGALALGAVLRVASDERQLVEQVRQHLVANPPAGECGDTTFTPLEAARGDVRALIAATCTTERQLREAGVERLVMQHSAPWYYVRFGMPLPSPYYSFNRAALPEQQQAVVDALRAYDGQALLLVRGFGALESYDVADGLRVPIIAAYLHERDGGAPSVATGIGELVWWNRPGVAPAPTPAATPDGLRWQLRRAVYDPASRFLSLTGRATDVIAGSPPTVEIAGARSDRRSTGGADGRVELSSRLPADVGDPPRLAVILTAADGRSRRIPIAPRSVVTLPPLRARPAAEIAIGTDSAAAAGRADRADRVTASAREDR